MSLKSRYLYALFILTLVVVVRENFDFSFGDREYFLLDLKEKLYLNTQGLRNIITSYIFANLKYFGEVLFSFLYYKNVFKLSKILFINTKIKNLLNRRIVYYSILLSLLAPVTIIFSSFAGKDILGIFIASELCIDLLNYKYQKEYKINIFKILKFIILTILFLILRKLSAIFLVFLIILILLLINPNRFKYLPLQLLPPSIFLIILSWSKIYNFFYQELYYQWAATIYSTSTFSPTNEFFTFDQFLINSYQMITTVSAIHFKESFIKATFMFVNSFLTYFVPISLGLIYFLKNLKVKNLFIFKALFLITFFVFNGFLSQNNPGGAIRYMSSAIPVFTTFVFAILPE